MNTIIKPASKASTTMYEVDDSHLTDKIDSESRHYKPFYDFISSLGFDACQQHPASGLETHALIDGEEFHIDFSNAPYWARNGFTRQWDKRKNRCIEIRVSNGYKPELVAKIKFNEEIDKGKLIDKIHKAINEKKAFKQSRIDKANNEMKLATMMRDYYFTSPIISTHVESVRVDKGFLYFNIKGASIKVDASTGDVKEFTPYEKRDEEKIKATDITKWVAEKCDIGAVANKVCSELKGMKPVGKEFTAYALEAYSRYVRKDRIEE